MVEKAFVRNYVERKILKPRSCVEFRNVVWYVSVCDSGSKSASQVENRISWLLNRYGLVSVCNYPCLLVNSTSK